MTTQAGGASRADDGFGLIEVVISMLVLAVLAIAFLPVLVQGIKQSAANATFATATQLVNEKLQVAQGAGDTCANISVLSGVETLTDEYGVTIQVTTTVGTCPAGTGTVPITVTAIRTDTAAVLVEGSSLVLVR
jgi:prepilin-type N-terminal cleavage/methylation domain-containing protein